MARLGQALKYFDTTLTTMGVGSDVTTFTASDFGRTFTTNGDGSDHGWGAHHFVMGGAVHGGDLYGTFPTYGMPDGNGGFTSPNQVAAGALLPTTSVDQYAATLGRWFGVADGDLAARAIDHDGLRVFQRARPGGGIADVSDGACAGQLRQ